MGVGGKASGAAGWALGQGRAQRLRGSGDKLVASLSAAAGEWVPHVFQGVPRLLRWEPSRIPRDPTFQKGHHAVPHSSGRGFGTRDRC